MIGILILLLSAGCTVRPGELSVGLGQEFSLAVGQSASVRGEGLKVRFVEVTSDSRCPAGATCVWQGEVSCLVEVTYNGSAERLTLTQPGLTAGPAVAGFRHYLVRFNVLPYPELGRQIGKEDYRLELVVSREP